MLALSIQAVDKEGIAVTILNIVEHCRTASHYVINMLELLLQIATSC
jgi:hypothetical protein